VPNFGTFNHYALKKPKTIPLERADAAFLLEKENLFKIRNHEKGLIL
jgi:hypothetical protein